MKLSSKSKENGVTYNNNVSDHHNKRRVLADTTNMENMSQKPSHNYNLKKRNRNGIGYALHLKCSCSDHCVLKENSKNSVKPQKKHKLVKNTFVVSPTKKSRQHPSNKKNVSSEMKETKPVPKRGTQESPIKKSVSPRKITAEKTKIAEELNSSVVAGNLSKKNEDSAMKQTKQVPDQKSKSPKRRMQISPIKSVSLRNIAAEKTKIVGELNSPVMAPNNPSKKNENSVMKQTKPAPGRKTRLRKTPKALIKKSLSPRKIKKKVEKEVKSTVSVPKETSQRNKMLKEIKAVVEEKVNVNITIEDLEHMKSVRVLLESSEEIQIKSKNKKRIFDISPLAKNKRATNPFAVFEFVYDQDENTQLKPKRKRAVQKRGAKKPKEFPLLEAKKIVKPKMKVQKAIKTNEIAKPTKMTLRKRKLPNMDEALESATNFDDVTSGKLAMQNLRAAFQIDPKNDGQVSSTNVPSRSRSDREGVVKSKNLDAEFNKLVLGDKVHDVQPLDVEIYIRNVGSVNVDKNTENMQQVDLVDDEVFSENDAPSPAPSTHSVRKDTAQNPENMVAELTESFLEDCESEPEVAAANTPTKKTPIRILSNIKIREARRPEPNLNPKQLIFNSTMNNSTEQSNPWRINLSTIRKNPYLFCVKDKSFVPSYDQNSLNGAGILQKRPSINVTSKESEKKNESVVVISDSGTQMEVFKENEITKEKQPDVVTPTKATRQTSILDFVNTNRLETKLQAGENAQTPRKVLGTLNVGQSTPLRVNHSVSILESPNLSKIDSTKNNQIAETLFGFSILSDSDKENQPGSESPKKSKQKSTLGLKKPTRFSPRKARQELFTEKPKQDERMSEVKESHEGSVDEEPSIAPAAEESQVIPDEASVAEQVDENDVPDILFIDVGGDLVKPPARRYERKTPKRRRLVSVDSVESEHEISPESHPKKKRKDIRTKAEEEEANRLAEHYNSMFEEIEQYPLCIE